MRAQGAGSGITVTVGGDCAVDVAPVEAALAKYGERLALVWFDAHADLNTPQSSPSGAFHGMVLRSLVGAGPAGLRPAQCIDPRRVVLAGARALDPGEQDFVTQHGIRRVDVRQLAEPTSILTAVRDTGADTVYVHIDLDVLDPQHFAAVGTPEPGGLSPDALITAFRALREGFDLAGVAITEYEPPDNASDGARDRAALQHLVRGLFGAADH